jgi:leucyl aminopeptidase
VPLELSLGRLPESGFASPFLAIALMPGAAPPMALKPIDDATDGAIGRALSRREFRGSRDEVLHLTGPEGTVERVVLVGMGKPATASAGVRRAAAIAARQATRIGASMLHFWHDGGDPEVIEAAALGLAAGQWEYRDLKTPPPEDERRALLESAVLLVDETPASVAALEAARALAEGHALARTLAMMPGNICTPDFLARTAQEIGGRHGMTVSVLGRAEMEVEGMGSFLCVAQGTPQDPKLIALEHRMGPADAAPLVLVGKGLCFDTGGISIKPAQGMESMKFDMCGAAGVLGAMDAIGRMGLAVNVVGLVGATTNMVSGTAVKPGDVVRSHTGKYIEIINTDAEGRLVLADLLSYARRFSPAAVVDAATLTGACVIALGHTATGVFGTDEALIREVLAAGERSGEPGWQLPLWDDYRELIKSDVADIKNSGGRPAGAISAAIFLREFATGYPWVHLDIAGTAYSEADLVAIPRGPTGVPVGTFVEFVRGRVS